MNTRDLLGPRGGSARQAPAQFRGLLGAATIACLTLTGCFDATNNAPTDTPIPNQAPVANAGANQTAFALSVVTVDGSASTDPDPIDARNLSYAWTFVSRPAGSTATLSTDSNPAKAKIATFTPDKVGDYGVQLTVRDGFPTNGSNSATVTITATPPPPVANAGPDQNFTVAFPGGVTVHLTGAGTTDPLGLPLTYAWVIKSFTPASGLPPASPVTLTNAGTVAPSFDITALDQLGTYTLTLTANNGVQSATDDVVVNAASIPPPVANAGPDQDVVYAPPGVTVQLDGTGSSDPGSLPLTYSWLIKSFTPASGTPPAAQVTLQNPNSATPSFAVSAVDQLGSYTLEVTVSNGSLVAKDTVVINVAKSFPAAGALFGSVLLLAGAAFGWWRRARK
jgi:hypothetical protein